MSEGGRKRAAADAAVTGDDSDDESYVETEREEDSENASPGKFMDKEERPKQEDEESSSDSEDIDDDGNLIKKVRTPLDTSVDSRASPVGSCSTSTTASSLHDRPMPKLPPMKRWKKDESVDNTIQKPKTTSKTQKPLGDMDVSKINEAFEMLVAKSEQKEFQNMMAKMKQSFNNKRDYWVDKAKKVTLKNFLFPQELDAVLRALNRVGEKETFEQAFVNTLRVDGRRPGEMAKRPHLEKFRVVVEEKKDLTTSGA